MKAKKEKPSNPARANSALMTRLGAVPIKVSMPLIRAATLSGIMSRLGAVPVLCAMRSAIGMKMATTPVELITEPRSATTSIRSERSRVSLRPAFATNQSPRRWATPVLTRPSPMTKRAAIRTMLGSAKPVSVSGTVSTPVNGSATIINSATASMRGRLIANMTTAATSRARTMASWAFMGGRTLQANGTG